MKMKFRKKINIRTVSLPLTMIWIPSACDRPMNPRPAASRCKEGETREARQADGKTNDPFQIITPGKTFAGVFKWNTPFRGPQPFPGFIDGMYRLRSISPVQGFRCGSGQRTQRAAGVNGKTGVFSGADAGHGGSISLGQ